MISWQERFLAMASALIFAGYVNVASSDTLFKGQQPVKIGLGERVGSRIEWSDCSKRNREAFSEPPYSLDKADNCSIGPPSFGLQCAGEMCTVVDADKLRKYVPAARNGDRVFLQIRNEAVELKLLGGESVHLER